MVGCMALSLLHDEADDDHEAALRDERLRNLEVVVSQALRRIETLEEATARPD